MILYNSRYRKEKKKGWHGPHGLGKKVKSEMSFPMLITEGHDRKGSIGVGMEALGRGGMGVGDMEKGGMRKGSVRTTRGC